MKITIKLKYIKYSPMFSFIYKSCHIDLNPQPEYAFLFILDYQYIFLYILSYSVFYSPLFNFYVPFLFLFFYLLSKHFHLILFTFSLFLPSFISSTSSSSSPLHKSPKRNFKLIILVTEQEKVDQFYVSIYVKPD